METLLIQLSQLQSWQMGMIATYLLLQGAIFTVFPEEVVAVTLGLLVSQNKIGFFHAWFSIGLGLLPANAFTVYMGKHFGPKLLLIRPFSWMFKKKSVDQALKKVKKYGTGIVFVTRFIPVIRGPIYLATGLSQMRILQFVGIDALASLIQIPSLLLLGKIIGKNATSLMDGYRKVGIFMALLLLFVIGMNWFYNHKSIFILILVLIFVFIFVLIKVLIGALIFSDNSDMTKIICPFLKSCC
jgi:membrane protein DedA with SNARE-associated domain